MSPVVLTLSCHWIQMVSDERMRLTNCATLRHFNPSLAQVMTSPFCTTLKSCGDGRVANQQVRIHRELTVTDLHTGGSGHVFALYWNEAAVEFGSPCVSEQPSLGFTQLTSMQEGSRKDALNI
ncbi:hypothetical protein RRG08_000168 [Elysia crispata]|uniref:Uncharacterized protein n=1 Tax=Elysia crispata TaxID=231223 RepID=A0AAE0YVY7_9GAST|nr:hypothetical protein RRG08_000168 [Elysia crispata]